MNNTGVTGRILPPKTDFEHARVWPTTDTCTHNISHEISIVWGLLRSPNYEYIARKEGFSWAPEIDFRYEIKARKVMVDFKFCLSFLSDCGKALSALS